MCPSDVGGTVARAVVHHDRSHVRRNRGQDAGQRGGFVQARQDDVTARQHADDGTAAGAARMLMRRCEGGQPLVRVHRRGETELAAGTAV
jgi:hypothetical protein